MDANSLRPSAPRRAHQSTRRVIVLSGAAATLGALAGIQCGARGAANRQPPGANTKKRPAGKDSCGRPGDACRKHADCCSKGAMCVEVRTETQSADGAKAKSRSRHCAAA